MKLMTIAKISVAGALVAMAVSGCTTVNPYTGQQQTSKTTLGGIGGALGGAILGAAVDGGRGAAVGALAGGALGSVVGNTMDRQDRELRRVLQGTGVQVRRTRQGVQLVMRSDVVFARSSANIKARLYPTLNSVARVLRHYGNTNIVVSGFTSNTGTAAYNQNLSERRAASVGAYLEGQGIDPHRVFTQGFGERYPVASNATARGRALNRRVVITLRQMSGQ